MSESRWGEVDYLVLGNSPGGVWLLSGIPEAVGSTPRMGWLCDQKPLPPLYVPQAAARWFGLKETRPVSVELLWPGDGMIWNAEQMKARFPAIDLEAIAPPSSAAPAHLKTNQWALGSLDAKRREALVGAVKKYPDLIGVADCFWKMLAKSDVVSLEMRIWTLFQSLELLAWEPRETTCEKFICSRYEDDIEAIRVTSDGAWEVRIVDKGSIIAKNIFFALRQSELRAIEKSFGQGRLPWGGITSQVGEHGLYSLSVDLEAKAIPAPMNDLTFLMDSWHIPEPETEIWPIEKMGNTLRFWISGKSDPSLNAIGESFQKAALRLSQLLPLSGELVKSYRPGLQWDDCVEEDVRLKVLTALTEDFQERYTLSVMETRTRWKNCFVVGPFVYTQWPYPLGELWAASQVAKQFAPKKKVSAVSTSPAQ